MPFSDIFVLLTGLGDLKDSLNSSQNSWRKRLDKSTRKLLAPYYSLQQSQKVVKHNMRYDVIQCWIPKLTLLRLERSIPYYTPPYQAPAGPRPTISGPDLPYQAPCILSWVSGNSRIFGFCFFKSNSRFHKSDWLTILLDG